MFKILLLLFARTTILIGGRLGHSAIFFTGGMPLKEIKTKPEGGKPKLLDKAAKAPKTAMKDLWLKSKDKSISELKETPFASQRGESSNAPANTAGDQMLSGMETAAKKGANLTYRGGKKLAQATARKVKEKRERFPAPCRGPKMQAARLSKTHLQKYGRRTQWPRLSKESRKRR